MKKLKLTTFDITGTLLSFRKSLGEIYSDAAKCFGIKVDPNVINVRCYKYINEMSQQHPNFGLYSGIGWQKWWRMVLSKTFDFNEGNGDNSRNLELLSDFLIESFSTKNEWELVDGSVGILEHLKSKGLTIGVISNFDPRLHKILKDIGIRKYFSFVIISYEAGFSKPDLRIFQVAEKKYTDLGNKFDRTTAVHIGDSFKHDYYGAINAGWNGVLIDPSRKEYRAESSLTIFNNLLELKEHFLKTC